MIPFLKRLFFDASIFERLVRTSAMVAGAAIASGEVPAPKWAGVVAMGVAAFIPAGEKNNGPRT